MDLVSVIVPVYNVEKYLRECLDSIVNQTYKKLEIILVDDGSTDNSGKICDEYAEWVNSLENEMCIKVVHLKNSGVSDARNSGLKYASGDWFFFVDSDDYISLNVIEVFLKLAKENSSDLVCGKLKNLSEGGAEKILKDFKIKVVQGGINLVKSYVISDSSIYLITNVNTRLYKKSVYGDLRFVSNTIGEDAIYTAELLPISKSVVFVDIPVYSYRDKREGSLSNNPNFLKNILEGITSSELCVNKIKAYGGKFEHLSEVYRAKSYMELAFIFTEHNYEKNIKKVIKEYRKKAFGKIVRAVFYKEIKFVTKIKLISAIISPVFYRKMVALYATFNN